MSSIFFFHGLESGPHGTKYRTMREAGIDVESPNFQGMTFEERLAKAEELTRGMTNLILVGSSFGGLLAAVLASKYPERVWGYVLCAPAFQRAEAAQIDRAPAHGLIIHGIDDEVVPFSASVEFAKRYGTELCPRNDDHGLDKALDIIVGSVRQMIDERAKDA